MTRRGGRVWHPVGLEGADWQIHAKSWTVTSKANRGYIAEQFDEVMTFLEQQAVSPGDEPLSQLLDKVDAPHVAAAWQKALKRRSFDPAGAITSARTLIKTVCKHLLDELKVDYSDTDDLPKLHRLTADSLKLAPSQHSEQICRQILGGCQSVVEGLGAMRNRLSDAHGTEASGTRPAPRLAELAVNLAGTMATFLLATWETKHK